jgi:hypothetical protein
MLTLYRSLNSRTDTMATFGFDRKEPPPAINMKSQRETEELQGFEDVAISTPFNVRKEGSINSQIDPNPPPPLREDPFLSSEEKLNYQTRGVYNPKTGGYTYGTAVSTYDVYQPPEISVAYDDRRPSSDLFDPLRPRIAARSSSYYGPEPTTQDLWPPPPPVPQMYMTQKSIVSSAYSQSGVGWKEPEPVRDSFMGFGGADKFVGGEGGFGRGPGGTIREKR